MINDNWSIVKGNILTKWAEDVDPNAPLPEYPRPQMVRDDWLSLNGLWEYDIVDKNQGKAAQYDGHILVPFCIESALSGVKRILQPEERLIYKRNIDIPKKWTGKKIILHFGAVDWESTVYINGETVVKHLGGYIPFEVNITEYLNADDNELIVSVWDPTDSHWQQKGKQKLEPKNIYYTPTSGIWQSVWLEAVDENYIKCFKATPDIDNGRLIIKCDIETTMSLKVRAAVYDGDSIISSTENDHNEELTLYIDDAILWSPDNPHLYDLKIELKDEDKIYDSIKSYFGMRKFNIKKDDEGIRRLALNNEILFQNGPLDQGYWPDGIYTAPTDEALKFDVEAAKALGFNMIRKHIKVEPARWYYWCDKIGIIVWQDMINGGKGAATNLDIIKILTTGKNRREDTSAKSYELAMRSEKESRDDFEKELKELIDCLYNVTSIGMWVIFNEAWGQFDSSRISKWVKEYDPTRIIDSTSGWWDQCDGELQSHHIYFKKLKMPKIRNDRAMILSEYGGFALSTADHVWTDNVFGYKKFETQEELEAAYISLIRDQVMVLKKKGCCGAVYTQTTDVEMEINGFYTYDREILKVNEKNIREVNEELISI